MSVTEIAMGEKVEKPIVVRAKGSLKVWSEKTGKYYYKSLDPNYYNNFFHKNKKDMTCDICNRTVTCQMYSHKKSKRCIARKQELELEELRQEFEKLKIQVAEVPKD